jgi:hypothetical protein
VFRDEDREPFDVLEHVIAMLEALDPAGDGFRYATTRIGQSSMIEDVYLDPQALLRLIREVDKARCSTVNSVGDRPVESLLLYWRID